MSKLGLLTLVLGSFSLVDAQAQPRVGPQKIILRTDAGDMLLALYPDVAPQHVVQILKLVRLGVYDTTHFYRIDPGFVVQISSAHDRSIPLTAEQSEAIKPIPAEFSDLAHQAGTLSMAREVDPNSAKTSFSILLGNAPHLDGKYTVFGHLEEGQDVLDRILKAPRDGTQPKERIIIQRAEILEQGQTWQRSTSPRAWPTETAEKAEPHLFDEHTKILVAAVLLMALGSLVSFFAFSGESAGKKFSLQFHASLVLINALVAGFPLFAIFAPISKTNQGIAVVVFLGLLGMIRLMGRFEESR